MLETTLAHAVAQTFGVATTVTAVEPLTGDASTRRYVRLRLAGGDAPTTVVAMILGEGRFAPGSDELGGGIAIDELPFLNVGRWLASRGFPVPAVHHDGSRDAGLLLLEDIGGTTLWDAASAAPSDAPALFARAVDLLVGLQVAGRQGDPACYAFARRFDAALAERELEHFVEHGIETRHGRPLDPPTRVALLADLAPVLEPFRTTTPVLVHRDFMAWNLHLERDRLRLIDFQDALLGPDAYDLAALCTDRTTARLVGPDDETALVGRFVAGRAAAGFPVPAGLPDRYARCALHRALKVIGRFHYLEVVRGRPGYLTYLPGVYVIARRMFDRLPELAAVRQHLARWVPELASGSA